LGCVTVRREGKMESIKRRKTSYERLFALRLTTSGWHTVCVFLTVSVFGDMLLLLCWYAVGIGGRKKY
jgi:hypothetical protein